MKDYENDSQVKKIKWACRRGMLELDVLLDNFLEEVFPTLTKNQQQDFISFLNYSDPELFSFLLTEEKPTLRQHEDIAKAIREHAKTRVSSKAI